MNTQRKEMNISYFIYVFLCGLTGCMLAKVKIGVKDWKYWIIIACVIGAYFCGKYA